MNDNRPFIVIFVMLLTVLGLVLVNKNACAVEDSFYLRGGTGLNYVNPFKLKDYEHTGKIKLKHTFPLIELGAGYQFKDGIRAELAFDHYFLFYSKERSKRLDTAAEYTVNTKTYANALMASGYKDVLFSNNASLFIGGGLGVSRLFEKAKGSVTCDGFYDKLDNTKSHTVYRLAYKLTAGVDYKLTDRTKIELAYNYFNLGDNKPKLIDGITNLERRNYSIHSVILSGRYTL